MWRPPRWWVIAAVVFLVSASYLLKRKRRAAFAIALGAIFAVGALTIQIRGSSRNPGMNWLGDGEQVTVTAHVIAEGDVQPDGPGAWHQRIDVETERVESEAQAKQSQAGVRLNIYSQSDPAGSPTSNEMPLFRYGQRIKFPATLIAPRNYRNPGAFDYAGYLRDHGISVTASTKYKSIEMLPGFSGSRIEQCRAQVHRSIVEKVHLLWPERIAGLMDAIVIGEEAFIGRPTRMDFQRSGTYHVLVVSGMNVSILAVFTCGRSVTCAWERSPQAHKRDCVDSRLRHGN